MSCRECRELMLPYLLNELSAEHAARLEQHVADCEPCATELASEEVLQSAMATRYAIPDPSPDFEAGIMAAVKAGHSGGSAHRGWSSPVMGGAIAAALALGVALGLGLKPGTDAAAPQLPEMAASQPAVEVSPGDEMPVVSDPVLQTVRLAFSSGRSLDDVTLTLELPANIELATFPGRQQLSWKVDLDQGENVLALPLKVLFPGSGDLVAHIDDGERRKTFRASIPGQTKLDRAEPAS